MFDPDRARQVAAALQTNETYIEKDWHLVRALGVIAAIHVADVTPVFSGGTSLARAWQLINRFSEDIDFKVIVAADSAAAERRSRKAYRESVVKALTEAGFVLDGEPLVSNEGRFFRVKFHYGATLPAAPGIRPSLQIEMTFTGTHLTQVLRPVQSLLAFATKTAPEVPELLCVDPVETAADKLSALAWRTATRDRSADKDDPSVIRHLHDLAALAPRVRGSPELTSLTRKLLQIDARERAKMPEADSLTMLSAMLPAIVSDPLWRKEYEEFVDAVSFGPDDARITFDQAVAVGQALVATVEAA